MHQYHQLLRHIVANGTDKSDRTGTGTRSVFGYQMRFDLSQGFPLLTTKKLHIPSIVYELLWFLRGDTNVKYLQDRGVRIWNEWANADGDLGPVYGRQWRSWPAAKVIHTGEPHLAHVHYIDQIANVIAELRRNPDSRRLVVSAWNVGELSEMALQPCHCLFQFNTRAVNGKRYLDCQLYQRSADAFLGVPFNIASYALLTEMIAHVCDLYPGDFVHTFGDLHIYSNHFEQVRLQLTREPKPLPRLYINPEVTNIDGFHFDDFQFVGYDPDPAIKAKVAV